MDSSRAFRGIWVAIIVLAGMVAAIFAGVACHMAGAALLGELGGGGGVFLGVVTLGLTVLRFLIE
jgi:hypothetical protein